MSLAGKSALVTGGGRGIGRAIAEELARAGAHVTVVGRTRAELDAVAAATGGAGEVADLSSRDDIRRFLEVLRSSGRRIDVLVNNAGIAESAPFVDTSDDAYDRMMDVNVTAPFLLTRAL